MNIITRRPTDMSAAEQALQTVYAPTVVNFRQNIPTPRRRGRMIKNTSLGGYNVGLPYKATSGYPRRPTFSAPRQQFSYNNRPWYEPSPRYQRYPRYRRRYYNKYGNNGRSYENSGIANSFEMNHIRGNQPTGYDKLIYKRNAPLFYQRTAPIDLTNE